MNKPRLYPSIRTDILTSGFPDWTDIKRNPTSDGRGLLNVFAIEFDKFEKKLLDVSGQTLLKTCNIDEIDHTWSFDKSTDISGSDETSIIPTSISIDVKSAELLSTATGVLDEETKSVDIVYNAYAEKIDLELLTNEEDFYKATPDGYLFEEVYDTNEETETLLNCQRHFQGSSESTADYALRVLKNDKQSFFDLYLPKYDDPTNTYRTLANIISSVDENSTQVEINAGVLLEDEFFILPSVINLDTIVVFKKSDDSSDDTLGDITIDGYNEISYHERESIFHKVYEPGELNYADYTSAFDFNNDGFITLTDEAHFKKMIGITPVSLGISNDEWDEQYGDYDLTKPYYEITETDLEEFQESIGTTHITDKQIIQFSEQGEYILVVDQLTDYGINGFIENNDNLFEWRANNYDGSLPEKHDSTYNDVAYDENTKYFYYSDDINKSIKVKTFNDMNTVADTFNIPLPIADIDEEIRGICIDDNGLLHVVTCDLNTLESSVYQIDTYSADMLDTIKKMALNYEILNDDYEDEYVSVHNYPLSNAYGISEFAGNRLIVTAGTKVYVLKPVYFKAIFSSATGTIHTRIKGDLLSVNGGEFYGDQFWYHVWNEFDEHALKFGLQRLLGESNYELKERIIDVAQRQPAASEQGYLYAVRRNLGLDTYDIIQDRYIFLSHAPVELPGNFSIDDATPADKPGILFSLSSISTLTFVLKTAKYDKQENIIGYKYIFYGFSDEIAAEDQDQIDGDLPIETYGIPLFELNGRILKRLYDYQSNYITARSVSYKYEVDGATAVKTENFIEPGSRKAPINRMEIINMKDQDRIREWKHGLFEDDSPTEKLETIVDDLLKLEKATLGSVNMDNSYYDIRTLYPGAMDSLENEYQTADEYIRSED